MNNERYNQIVDEAYKNYAMTCIKRTKEQEKIMKENGGWLSLCLTPYFESKEEFISKSKTDVEFSERWGLKIEEREVFEQVDQTNPILKGSTALYPLKLITETYKDEKIEVYE